MRQIRKVLELLAEGKHSTRHIARLTGVSRPVIAEYELRATLAGLVWPLPVGTSDRELESRLFPSVKGASKSPESKKG
jgi:hypothetical protein